eukprot:gene8838-biopygen7931
MIECSTLATNSNEDMDFVWPGGGVDPRKYCLVHLPGTIIRYHQWTHIVQCTAREHYNEHATANGIYTATSARRHADHVCQLRTPDSAAAVSLN